ncbi:MAG: hypothetical protein ACYTFM_12045, partial [Planctomycetota bacterium]
MTDSLAEKSLPTCIRSRYDKTSGFIRTWIVFAFLLAFLCVNSYASEDDLGTELNDVKSALESLLEGIESLEAVPAVEPNLKDEAVVEKAKPEKIFDPVVGIEIKAADQDQAYILVDFETDDHGWIAAGSGQGKFEIGVPIPFDPCEGSCLTDCFGTGPSEDHSATGVKAACTNLDGYLAPKETLYTNRLNSPVYDFSGCSNVTLELWRFMEIEGRNSDFCYFQYKNDPLGKWITFETYGDIEVDDDEWDIYTKDLSSAADGKSYFQLRFYCTTDGWTEGSGLCLDDIMISWSRDDEPQSLLPRPTEFDTGSEGMTDPLIAEYEQEIATFKAEAEKKEVKAETQVSEPEVPEEHTQYDDPNSINSALAALIEQLKDVEPATEAKPKVESEIIKEKTRFEEEAKLKTEDRLQAQGSSELEEAQETTDILKVEYEQEIIKSKTKTLYQAKRLKAEEEKKEYFFVGFETDDHGWIAAGSGQGKFEIGKPVPFEPNEGDCQTACFGTGPSQDQSALGVNAACTNLDGHMAPLDTLFTSSLTSPIYDFSGCSNVSL